MEFVHISMAITKMGEALQFNWIPFHHTRIKKETMHAAVVYEIDQFTTAILEL